MVIGGGKNINVIGNMIFDLKTQGIAVYGNGNAENVSFVNNLIWSRYATDPAVYLNAMVLSGVSGLKLINNTIGDIGLNNGMVWLSTSEGYSTTVDEMHNNIIPLLWVQADKNDAMSRVIHHSNNIFGNDADNTGGTYKFHVDPVSELADYDIVSLFADPDNDDFRPKIDSVICNGSHPGSVAGIAWAGALPCVVSVPCRTGADKPICDGEISMAELTAYIQEWYKCSACVPDLFQALEAFYGY
jgi:hypothetical protein